MKDNKVKIEWGILIPILNIKSVALGLMECVLVKTIYYEVLIRHYSKTECREYQNASLE